ncbi:MAG: hypothetical protein GX329_06530 [Tissierellia bacterium]|nr:hypothetical protein [Tissierellia bacterium]
MNRICRIIIRSFMGYFVCALGITMTINAGLGLAPWDVLHQGLAGLLGLTIGRANILVGLSLVILNHILGERIGWGTLCNMLFVGIFVDFLMLNEMVPIFNNLILSFIMMLLGVFVLGIGSYLYIGVGLGSGPRDGLMVALVKRTNKSVGLIRGGLELMAVTLGYMLGGYTGFGTLVLAIANGYLTQLAFKVTRFNVKEVEHRFIDDDIRLIREKFGDKLVDDVEVDAEDRN